MKNIIQTLTLCIALACGACTVDTPVADVTETGTPTEIVYRLVLQADRPSYEGSRADASWGDGEVVYIKFATVDDKYITGFAAYRADDQSWVLHCTGTLPTVTDGECTIYYFEGEYVDVLDGMAFSPTTCAYTTNTKYTKTSSAVLITATLKPMNGRVRFTGTPGRDFTLSGLRICESFNTKTYELTYCTSTTSAIGEDGSSPYIYLNKSMPEDPVLTISYDNLSFTRLCESPILDAGTSGYMQLPTRDTHNKWEMSETTAPIMGKTIVSDIGVHTATFEASIVSDGNADITERGFVYATTDNPTTSDNKLACRSSELKATVDGLKANTTYYVRAYAINSEGIGYSSTVTFTTPKDIIIDKDPYPDDNNWDSRGSGIVDKGGYDNDNDWNGTSDTGVGKGGYGPDSDWNASSSSSGVGKGGYEPDSDWNKN